MSSRYRLASALCVLFLVFSAVPAVADEGGNGANTGLGAGQIAFFLSAEFETDLGDVVALHEAGLGFGDIFRLEALALALGTDVATLLDDAAVDPETGEHEINWGELKQHLTDEQLALLDELPKNLGQIISAVKSWRPDHAGKGKPSWAKKPGRPSHGGHGRAGH